MSRVIPSRGSRSPLTTRGRRNENMSEKRYGLSKNGWICFVIHVIISNVALGHSTIFGFIGGLFGSYIFVWIVFKIYEAFTHRKKQDKDQGGE